MSVGPAGPTHERVAYQRWQTRANSTSVGWRRGAGLPWRLPSQSNGRQDLWTVFRYCDRVLEMGGQGAVAGHDRPAVRLDRDLMAAEGQHRLDREADPGHELHPANPGSIVRKLRLLVHLGPDAVADELTDDAVAAGRRGVLDRRRDIAEVGPRHGRGDPGHHRQAGRVDQVGDLRVGRTDHERA